MKRLVLLYNSELQNKNEVFAPRNTFYKVERQCNNFLEIKTRSTKMTTIITITIMTTTKVHYSDHDDYDKVLTEIGCKKHKFRLIPNRMRKRVLPCLVIAQGYI